MNCSRVLSHPNFLLTTASTWGASTSWELSSLLFSQSVSLRFIGNLLCTLFTSPVVYSTSLSFPKKSSPFEQFRFALCLYFSSLLLPPKLNPCHTAIMRFSAIILSAFVAAVSVSAQNSTSTTAAVVSGTAGVSPAQSSEAACLVACESCLNYEHHKQLLISPSRPCQ